MIKNILVTGANGFIGKHVCLKLERAGYNVFAYDLDNTEEELIDFVNESNIPYYFVITKSDKLNQSAKAATVKRIKEYGFPTDRVLYTSRLEPRSWDKLRQVIEKIV